MQKRRQYVIHTETFATKRQLQERIRGLVAAYQDDEPLTVADLAFVCELLDNHPNATSKIGCGISSIYVRRNPIYPATRGFYLVRADGSGTDFSWMECIASSSHHKKAKRAFRSLVEPYTMRFKQAYFDSAGKTSTCPITGNEITFLSSHVDHVPPATFDAILFEFCSLHGLDLNTIALKDELSDDKYQDKIEDSELAALWVGYHNAKATLRVVSPTANLSHIKLGRG